MCDLACVSCDEYLGDLALIEPPPGRGIILLCPACDHPNCMVRDDGHLRMQELDARMREALLLDPAYQRIVFEKAMGHS